MISFCSGRNSPKIITQKAVLGFVDILERPSKFNKIGSHAGLHGMFLD